MGQQHQHAAARIAHQKPAHGPPAAAGEREQDGFTVQSPQQIGRQMLGGSAPETLATQAAQRLGRCVGEDQQAFVVDAEHWHRHGIQQFLRRLPTADLTQVLLALCAQQRLQPLVQFGQVLVGGLHLPVKTAVLVCHLLQREGLSQVGAQLRRLDVRESAPLAPHGRAGEELAEVVKEIPLWVFAVAGVAVAFALYLTLTVVIASKLGAVQQLLVAR